MFSVPVSTKDRFQEDIQEMRNPHVMIDAGSTFAHGNTRHTKACGYMACKAALELQLFINIMTDVNNGYDVHKIMLDQGKFDAYALKEVCGRNGRKFENDEIVGGHKDGSFNKIAKHMFVSIEISSGNEVINTHDPHYGNGYNIPKLRLNLYANHYRVIVPDGAEDLVDAFIETYGRYTRTDTVEIATQNVTDFIMNGLCTDESREFAKSVICKDKEFYERELGPEVVDVIYNGYPPADAWDGYSDNVSGNSYGVGYDVSVDSDVARAERLASLDHINMKANVAKSKFELNQAKIEKTNVKTEILRNQLNDLRAPRDDVSVSRTQTRTASYGDVGNVKSETYTVNETVTIPRRFLNADSSFTRSFPGDPPQQRPSTESRGLTSVRNGGTERIPGRSTAGSRNLALGNGSTSSNSSNSSQRLLELINMI